MKLVEPQNIYETEFREFIAEFEVAGEKLVPYSLNMKDRDFKTYIQSLINESLGVNLANGWVAASTLFLADEAGKIYGAANLRHKLTKNLEIEGGHIGYGIRPSQRSKGLGTLLLKLALQKIKELGIIQVLITCNKENIVSARVITNIGGIFDSEIAKDGNTIQRYWVEI